MWFLYDNIVAIAVASVASILAWLYGGTIGSKLIPVVPWLVIFLVEIMLCFPQRHRDETPYEARERVWYDLKRDPLTWVVLGFLALLLVPFVNKGLCPICDYPAIVEGADPSPTIPFIPYCVDRMAHLNVVLWFLPALTAMLAVKHSLAKHGKRLFIELMVWNGVGLAVLGFVQQVFEAPAPLWLDVDFKLGHFFSTWGYPNMAGDYFTTLFALAVASWRRRVKEVDGEEMVRDMQKGGKVPYKIFWRKHVLLIPSAIFFFAALTTLSRAAIMLVSALAVVFFLHSFASFFKHLHRVQRVRMVAGGLFVLVAVVLAIALFTPDDLQREVDTINTEAVLDRVTGKGQYHVRVATEIWKKNFFFGCGGWGYKHLCIPFMTDAELKNIQMTGGINVHNDHLQFLAEHGLVGYGCLVAMVVLLVLPVCRQWRALARAARFLPSKEQPARPIQLFALPAPVFCISLGAVATVIHSCGDCAMRSPAVLILFFTSLAALDGYMPHSHEH